jgi:hypothetical protein
MVMRAYISMACPNCTRFLSDMTRIPSLKNSVEIVDVDRIPPEQKAGLQYVPTLVDNSGRQFIGTKCFEWLQQFQTEIELDSAPDGKCLAFSDLNGGGEMGHVQMFGEFVKPPPE